MTSEEAQLEFVIITQTLEGYGDKYYPAKVSDFTICDWSLCEML